MAVVRHKEAIHSGHFMISNFEAEEQDDEENIAVPVTFSLYIFDCQISLFQKSCPIFFFLHQNDHSVKGYRPIGCATSAAAANGGHGRITVTVLKIKIYLLWPLMTLNDL